MPTKNLYYDLEKFLVPYDFPTDPEDGIKQVKLLTVTLKPLNNQCSITLTMNQDNNKSLHTVADEWFDIHNPFSSGFVIYKITLLIKLYSSKTLPITLAYPCFCDLSRFNEQERELIIKYLKRWGLIEEY